MSLLLHTPDSESELSRHYQRAFQQAVELFIVTAYLTEWDKSLELNHNCRNFRVIIGKDFGITRKAACEAVMRWLPSNRKGQFMVADMISGFHPKAVFWKESNHECFAIIGSSNLTRAAFETNYEANIFSRISIDEYAAAKSWVKNIEKKAVAVSEDWLARYKEARVPASETAEKASRNNQKTGTPLVAFKLPRPAGMKEQIALRRNQLIAYEKNRAGLIDLFRRCANEEVRSTQFYEQLPAYWSHDLGDRLQGAGWERQGKDSDFRALSESYLRILDAADEDRDDVVIEEIDALRRQQVATRKALLSEMLCLQFPREYPVLNKPVKDYLKAVKFKAPRGSSEGVCYVDLAKKLRFSLLQNPEHPAMNLAELDAVIWLAFGKK
jgi:HKD family nuclease